MEGVNKIGQLLIRAPDKMHIFISIMPISSPNPMFDLLLELFHRDNYNKWLNIGIGEEITQVVLIEVIFTHLIMATANVSHWVNNIKCCLQFFPFF